MSDSPSPEPARPRVPRGLGALALAEALGASAPDMDLRITGVGLDSRTVLPGDLWCALPGENAHGAQFAAQAAERGALLALTDEAGRERCVDAGLPVLVVDDPRRATARAAALVYGEPARGLRTIGVTGTNGKTSVTSIAVQTLAALGRAAGTVGTSGTAYRDSGGGEHRIRTVRTTPEAPELHGILARMIEDGVEVAAMEISSHALVLHRADDVVVDVACFTNLSQDHLNFHGTMEAYYRAKRLLFTPEHARRGVICVDDDWGRRLAAEAEIPVITYATTPGRGADYEAVDVRREDFGTAFTARGPREDRALHAALPGMHYVANTLAVSLLLGAVGVHGDDVDRVLGQVGTVPGRMELVARRPVRGVVDYSHTPAALEHALSTLREVPDTRRLLVVVGAGGDRDHGKRPLMGEAAARGADVVIITDDNPRSEDPAEIRRAVLAGVPAGTSAHVHESDGRAAAIALAAELADVGDTILVAGKGAETGQDIGGIVHSFDDRVELRAALAARGLAGDDQDDSDGNQDAEGAAEHA